LGSTQKIELSMVIPVFNEEDSVTPLSDSIIRVMGNLDIPFELIFVDDGSTDKTYDKLEKLCNKYPHMVIIRLTRNFGQTSALAAGIHNAKGKYIITMDGDLQNDPEDIPRIIELLDDGYDIVSGWRKNRKDSFMMRLLPSIVANKILSWVTNVKIHDFGCTLKGYRAAFLRRVRLYSDMHRYIPGMATAVGAKVKEIVVRHHARKYGVSKYGISRATKVLSDMILLRMLIRFSAQPLHYFGILSLPVFLFATVLSFLAFVDTHSLFIVSYTTIVLPTIAILTFFLAFHFIMVGLLCELVVKVGEESIEQLYSVETLSRGKQ